MKRSLIALAAATALGVTVLAIGPTFADSDDGPAAGGYGPGYGMMGGYGPGYGMRGGYGPGYGMRGGYGPGYGMMGGYGPGYGMRGGYGPGYGMMGHRMGPWMMGYGRGNAGFPCPGYAAATASATPLTLDDARKIVEQRLAWMGNDRLTLGKIEAKGDNAFVAEIVTPDKSLVQKLEIDRRTGFTHPVR